MLYTIPAESGKYVFCLPLSKPTGSMHSLLNPPKEGCWVEVDWAYPKGVNELRLHITTHGREPGVGYPAQRITLGFFNPCEKWKRYCPLELSDPGSDVRPAVVNMIGDSEHTFKLTSRYVKNLCRSWLASWIWYLGSLAESDVVKRCAGIANMTDSDPAKDDFGRPMQHPAWDIWRNAVFGISERIPVCGLADEEWRPFQGMFMDPDLLNVQEYGARARLEQIGFLDRIRNLMNIPEMQTREILRHVAAFALLYADNHYTLIDDMVTLHLIPSRPRFLLHQGYDYTSGIAEKFLEAVSAACRLQPITAYAQKSSPGLLAACQRMSVALGRVVQPEELKVDPVEATHSVLKAQPVLIQTTSYSVEASKDPEDVLVGVGVLEVRRPDFEEAENALRRFDNRRKSRSQTQFEKGI